VTSEDVRALIDAARKAWRRLAARAQAAGSELESWIADLERV
jgi:hypothetical protein